MKVKCNSLSYMRWELSSYVDSIASLLRRLKTWSRIYLKDGETFLGLTPGLKEDFGPRGGAAAIQAHTPTCCISYWSSNVQQWDRVELS